MPNPADLCTEQNTKPMKSAILFVLLLSSSLLSAQIFLSGSVLSAGGQSAQLGNISINSTFGETFIFSQSIGTSYWGQGFQTNNAGLFTSTVDLGPEPLQVKLYPNPVSAQLYLKTDAPVTEVQLFSGAGQLMLSQPYDEGTPIRMHSLPSGLYFVHARIEGRVFMLGRIVKVD